MEVGCHEMTRYPLSNNKGQTSQSYISTSIHVEQHVAELMETTGMATRVASKISFFPFKMDPKQIKKMSATSTWICELPKSCPNPLVKQGSSTAVILNQAQLYGPFLALQWHPGLGAKHWGWRGKCGYTEGKTIVEGFLIGCKKGHWTQVSNLWQGSIWNLRCQIHHT